MAKIIAIANQKGGVGKTTTCVNLAASLAAMHKKVLVIDSDPQGNATMASGVNKFDLKYSIYNVLIDGVSVFDALIEQTTGAFHLIPANEDLTAAEVKLLDMLVREFRLKNAIAPIKDNYDYILIDCPPSLNLLTVNAMCAADSILVPLQCEYFALEGLTLLIDTVDQLATQVNPHLKIEGILRTMFDGRNNLSGAVSQDLQDSFGDLVYKTIINRNVRLAEAPSYGQPVMYFDKNSQGAKNYLQLAAEILEKDVLEQNRRLQALKALEAKKQAQLQVQKAAQAKAEAAPQQAAPKAAAKAAPKAPAKAAAPAQVPHQEGASAKSAPVKKAAAAPQQAAPVAPKAAPAPKAPVSKSAAAPASNAQAVAAPKVAVKAAPAQAKLSDEQAAKAAHAQAVAAKVAAAKKAAAAAAAANAAPATKVVRRAAPQSAPASKE